MNTQPTNDQNIGHKTPSPVPLADRDKPQPIRYWQQRYERFLELAGLNETRKRYARAIERFLGKYPDRVYGHQFLRPVIIDYVKSRLGEGASVSTVRLEMSAIRGLFQFALDMGAYDVLVNPAKNVKVKKTESRLPEGAHNPLSEMPSPIET